jgi:hypothetical protein
MGRLRALARARQLPRPSRLLLALTVFLTVAGCARLLLLTRTVLTRLTRTVLTGLLLAALTPRRVGIDEARIGAAEGALLDDDLPADVLR